MNRRDFLKQSTGSLLLGAGTSASFLFSSPARAVPGNGRVLVNVMLLGGADLRHLIVPAYGSAPTPYASAYWTARETIHRINAEGQWDTSLPWNPAAVWANEYQALNSAGQQFGLLGKCAWLIQQYQLGNVAIICNVKGSLNRRHDHSQLIMNTGRPEIENYNFDSSGWGGRLVESVSSSADSANVVSLSDSVSMFCKSSNSNNRNSRTISAPDMRNITLTDIPEGMDNSNIMSRALKAYYARLGIEMDPSRPQYTLVEHERTLRRFGQTIKTSLDSNPRPQPLVDLYTAGLLHSRDIGEQCANVYDAFHVSDILKFRVASLIQSGWDTHKTQKQRIEDNLEDLFGAGKSLDILTQSLEDSPGANDNLVYVFTSDFGRQLKSNGSAGTDHGSGNYMLVIGRPVRGGVYGTMFPDSEIIRYPVDGEDIAGLTSFERVLAQVCDWIEPRSGNTVFPGRLTAEEEPGANIYLLFEQGSLFTLNGTLRTDSGTPLPNALVQISNGTGIRFSVTTDALGRFSQGALPADFYTLTPQVSGYAFEQNTLVQIRDRDIDVTLIGSPSFDTAIFGRIETLSGGPAMGITVLVSDNFGFTAQSVTDRKGRYRLAVPDGQYLVQAQTNADYASISPVGGITLIDIKGTDVELDFIATSALPMLYGSVHTADGTGISGIVIRINNSSGVVATLITDSSGRFSSPLADGLYYLYPHANRSYPSIEPADGSIIVDIRGTDVIKDFIASPA